jgi:hypothetical protein
MWLVWLAIILLFFLVMLSSLREGITSQQLFEVQNIINNADMKPDDKVKALYGENASVSIVDIPIINILKNTTIDSEEKINLLKLYFINIVNERNKLPLYNSVPNKISSEKFFLLNDVINNPDFDNYEDKIIQIKSIDIKEKTFSDIIFNNSISDEVKIYGEDDFSGPTLSSLINEALLPINK